MPREADALRTARTLLRLHGEHAEREAQTLWQMHRNAGATTAARVWQRVLTTLASLRTGERRVLH